ncbi:MAG: hypothetical protein LM517_07270 [Nitrosomonas sp.]|nr:hypothetical protein [Nitrosomonas sp.]
MSNLTLYSGQRFRKALQHFLLGRVTQAIAFFALTLWLVRILTPSDYGAYMVLWGMVEMLMPLSSLGMIEGVRRFLPELAGRGAPGVLRKFVFWMALIRFTILLIFSIIIIKFWSEFTLWLGFSSLQQDSTVLAPILVITVLGFRYTVEMLECLLEQRWSQTTQALLPIGRTLGVAILTTIGSFSLERLLYVDIIVSSICFLVAEFFLIRKLKNLNGTGDYYIDVREIVTFVWHMMATSLLWSTAGAGALRIIVARVLGLESAGMFAFLQQLQTMIGRYLPANLLYNIIRPIIISRYTLGEISIVSRAVSLLWKINLIIVTICVVAVAIAGDSLIAFISSNRFTDAGVIMLIMLLSLGAAGQSQLINSSMQIFSYTRQLRYFSLLAILAPISVVIGSNWDLIGVAIGITVSIWILNSSILLWLNRQAKSIEFDWYGALRGISLAVFIVIIGLIISHEFSSWWGFVFALLAYYPGLALVKPLNRGDMALLHRVLKKNARFLKPFVLDNSKC